jgi:hypothetical protein
MDWVFANVERTPSATTMWIMLVIKKIKPMTKKQLWPIRLYPKLSFGYKVKWVHGILIVKTTYHNLPVVLLYL